MSPDGRTDGTVTQGNTSTSSAASRRFGLDDGIRSIVHSTAKVMRVVVLAGIPTGVLVIGFGGRLAMFALRLTSSPNVVGIESDDGFEIGRFTLFGTYNLSMSGAFFGVLGAAAYLFVRPWLIGPMWFRYLTLALASGAVGGSMLVHADGIDFRLLDPMWFAVALFVTLPAFFAVCVAWAVEYMESREVPDGSRRWIVPVVLPLLFPFSAFAVVAAALIATGWFAIRQSADVASIARKPAVVFVVRVLLLSVPVLGALELFGDISELRRIN